MKDEKFEEKCTKSVMCTVVKKGVEKGIEENNSILSSELLDKVEKKCKDKKISINSFIAEAVERAIMEESKKTENLESLRDKKGTMDAIMSKAVDLGIAENEIILDSELLDKVEEKCKHKKISINDFIAEAVERAIKKEEK